MPELKDALLKLDVGNDNHWTGDGLPRIETVKMLASNPAVTREMIAEAAPGFSRATAVGYALLVLCKRTPGHE